MINTQPQLVTDIDAYLARYLRLLPDDAHRAAILRRLKLLEPDAAGELLGYLRQLDISAAADPRFRETYLFAPRQWSARSLAESAGRWAHPALRHLVPVSDDVPTKEIAAMPFFREPGGISDMWLLRFSEGTAANLDTWGSTLAIAPPHGTELAVDGHTVGSPTVVAPRQRSVSVAPLASTGQGCLAILVASRALMDTAPAAQWLTLCRADALAPTFTATAETRQPKYRPGPRSSSIGQKHVPAPSSDVPWPAVATSAGQSPPR